MAELIMQQTPNFTGHLPHVVWGLQNQFAKLQNDYKIIADPSHTFCLTNCHLAGGTGTFNLEPADWRTCRPSELFTHCNLLPLTVCSCTMTAIFYSSFLHCILCTQTLGIKYIYFMIISTIYKEHLHFKTYTYYYYLIYKVNIHTGLFVL